jgi:hypothetical protein
MLNTVFQVVLIIWGCLSILLMIGLAVGALIVMRRARSAADQAKISLHQARDKITDPVERAKEGWAYVRGAMKGVADSVDIMRGKEVSHDGNGSKEAPSGQKR